ncbi:M28 family metallopeptidase [Nonomuraea zeae]|uniref:M28 family metallopeptidase n=1 Tax=Nonomuraea zeae TaxID=1642303 RepID=UPI001981515B|nr:M28 family metallopeptidase [Nonomuraea zeae]
MAAAAMTMPAVAAPAHANPDPASLVAAVTADHIQRHVQALQSIADTHGGTRASGTSGYDASAQYVAGRLRSAGLNVALQPFSFPFYQENAVGTLEQVSPESKSYAPTPPNGSTVGDFFTMIYSGAGDVRATVQSVDLPLPPTPTPSSTSGCETEDFADFKAGNIALIQRGSCDFAVKAANAKTAGAAAVIIFNSGQPGRTGTIQATLGNPVGIPVVGTTFALGEDLASPTGTVAHLKLDTTSEMRTTHNVIAESPGGDSGNVVMLGAHLDSVVAGPGINDNASGSVGLLEAALLTAKLKPHNKVRFAWWGAEEFGLRGSTEYVNALSADQLGQVKLYLNFDMIASPNYALQVYDGDGSGGSGAPVGPPGSSDIEKNFQSYYETLGLRHTSAAFNGRSDYGPFIEKGIPAGGIFTGSDGLKTAEEQQLFGGTAGTPYDSCYHRSCDTAANINAKALLVNTGAIVYATATYAFDENLPGTGMKRTTGEKDTSSHNSHGEHDRELTR